MRPKEKLKKLQEALTLHEERLKHWLEVSQRVTRNRHGLPLSESSDQTMQILADYVYLHGVHGISLDFLQMIRNIIS